MLPHFFVAQSVLNGPNTSAATKTPLRLYNQSLKPNSKRTLATPKLLSIVSGVSLEKTSNTS